MFNITDFLDSKFQETTNKKMELISEDDSITFDSLFHVIMNLSKWLIGKGIKSGDIVCINLPNSIESLSLFWSLLYIKSCPFFINLHESKNVQEKIIEESSAKFIILTSEDRSSLSLRFFLNSYKGTLRFSVKNLSPKIKISAPGKFLQFTSGSTGSPKAIVHDQADMLAAHETYGKSILNLSSNDVIYSPANYSYAFSFSMSTFQALFFNSKVVVSDTTNPWQIIDNIKKFQPTVLCSVPSLYKAFLAINGADIIKKFSSITLYLSSGESLPPALNKEWLAKTKKPLIDGVGSSEAIAGFISNSKQDYVLGSSGKAVKGYDVKFLAADKNTGSIQITGDSISTISLSDLIKGTVSNQKTIVLSDIFNKDSKGYFRYLGRSNFMLKNRGKWVNPIEVEDLCNALDYVNNTLLFKDNKSNMLILLVSTLSKPNKVHVQSNIKSFLRKEVDSYKIPDEILIVDKIPLNTNGKINRRGLSFDLLEKDYGN